MNIESAKIAIDKMASFLPEHVLNDLYKDHDAVAHIISKETDKLVFSVIFNNGDKRILTITVKRNEINVHYNNTMQVFSKLITVEFFNAVLNVLLPEVETDTVKKAIVSMLNDYQDIKMGNIEIVELTSDQQNTIDQAFNVDYLKDELAIDRMFDYDFDDE